MGYLVVGSTLVSGGKVKAAASRGEKTDAFGYTESERRQLAEMRRRDRQVRIDEKPKFTEMQGLTQGVPKYTMVKGPDGRMYAVGGQLELDTTPEETPEETIVKAQKIRAVATTSFNLSPDDIRFIARASMMEMEARGEIQMEMMEKVSKIGEVKSPEWTDSIDEDDPITEVIAAVKAQKAAIEVSAGALNSRDPFARNKGLADGSARQAEAAYAYMGRYQFTEPTLEAIA